MSSTTKLATAALAAAVASLTIGSALANTKGPSSPPSRPPIVGGGPGQTGYHTMPHHFDMRGKKFTRDCYYLPTVTNGSVSGLQKTCWAGFR
jgi:hypothetical protein